LIAPITDNETVRRFFNALPYPEHWPEGLDAIAAGNRFFGVYNPSLIGVFWLQPRGMEAEAHVGFVKECRGPEAKDAAERFSRWVFENTEYHTIFAEVIEPHVALFAKWCGMKRVNGRFEVQKCQKV
jgi:hypothetical protein